jgi:hypothetical protein
MVASSFLTGASFSIVTPFFGIDGANDAKFGKDVLIQCPNLTHTMSVNGFPFIQTANPESQLQSQGFHGGNTTDAIPLVCYLADTPASVIVKADEGDRQMCGFSWYPCKTLSQPSRRYV